MKNTLRELFDKEILTKKELSQLEEDEEVIRVETLGTSGVYSGFTWLDVTLNNGNRYDVYCKY